MLESGSILFQDINVNQVIKKYFQSDKFQCNLWQNLQNSYSNQYFELIEFGVYDKNHSPILQAVPNDEDLWIGITIDLKEPNPSLELGFNVTMADGHILFWSYFYDSNDSFWKSIHKGKNILKSRLPKRFFNNGIYSFNLIAGLRNIGWFVNPQLDTVSIDLDISGRLSNSLLWNRKRTGSVAPVLQWEVEHCESKIMHY